MAVRTINVLSLCSGGGGLDAGFKLAIPEARTVCYVENEVTEAGVLAKAIDPANGWLDDAPIWSDIRTFDPKPWRGLVDCIIGGYPCQPFSTAGQRAGTSDPRHLWPYIERIIQELSPTIVFFENVEGHLKLGYYDKVRPSLTRMGYLTTEGLFTAAEVDAPHIRRRLFILGYRKEQLSERPWQARQGRPRSSNANIMVLGDANSTRRLRRVRSEPESANKIPPWPPSPAQSQETWTRYIEQGGPKPTVRRGANGVAWRRDELRVLGNAVVPVVAARAFVYLTRGLLT